MKKFNLEKFLKKEKDKEVFKYFISIALCSIAIEYTRKCLLLLTERRVREKH